MTKTTVLGLTVAAAFGISVPFATFTVFGSAELTGRLHDTIRVGIAVEQVDGGLSELSLQVPHTDALEYRGVEVGPHGGEISAEPVDGGVAITWTGQIPAGAEEVYVGYVLLDVARADRSTFRAQAENETGKDLDGIGIEELVVAQSEATVVLVPRPTELRLDVVVEPGT